VALIFIFSIQRLNNFNLTGFLKDFAVFVFNGYKHSGKGALGMESGALI